jgi:dihydrodipicolinate synthase/N-acetylneuraminate lyase
MHDIADLESRGLPGVGVASTEFVQAAAAQAQALGFDAAMVFVAHPIQDRSDDELRALADAALPGIVQRLVAAAPAGG